MNAFEQNKYSPAEFVKIILANSTIVSYGFITTIDFDSVVVSPVVSDTGTSDKIRCTFMNLGSELFSVIRKPALGMRVLVLSPNKAAEGMYESYQQITINEGRDYILTGSTAAYSSQFAFCIPIMKSGSNALNSLVLESNVITAEIKNEIMAVFDGAVELDITADSSIELHEGTEHFRGCYGNIEETFGMVPGSGGTEKEGTYKYQETYGKYSSVEKNYESGFKMTVGKAYEKPFLENKGALADVAAPVTIDLGADSPVTITFGESEIVIKADTTTGIDIAVKGTQKVNITAETGLVKVGNSIGTLALIFNDLITALSSLVTIGGPTQQSISPATVTALQAVKTKITTILE